MTAGRGPSAADCIDEAALKIRRIVPSGRAFDHVGLCHIHRGVFTAERFSRARKGARTRSSLSSGATGRSDYHAMRALFSDRSLRRVSRARGDVFDCLREARFYHSDEECWELDQVTEHHEISHEGDRSAHGDGVCDDRHLGGDTLLGL